MTEKEKRMDDILRDHSSADPSEDQKTYDRILQRLAEAMKVQGLEERAIAGSLGFSHSRPLALFEQLVLAATLELGGDEVESITDKVNEHLVKASGRTAVFFTLNRLEGEGLIASTYAPRRSFKVTEDGERALAAAKARAKRRGEEDSDPLGDFV